MKSLIWHGINRSKAITKLFSLVVMGRFFSVILLFFFAGCLFRPFVNASNRAGLHAQYAAITEVFVTCERERRLGDPLCVHLALLLLYVQLKVGQIRGATRTILKFFYNGRANELCAYAFEVHINGCVDSKRRCVLLKVRLQPLGPMCRETHEAFIVSGLIYLKYIRCP